MDAPRERSFWSWGFRDRFPDDDARRALAAQVGAILQVDDLEPLPLPRIEDVHLHPSRLGVPPRFAVFVTSDHDARVRHTYGRAYRDLVRGLRGDFASAPDLVAFPRDEADITALFEWCAHERVALTPYGGGTSVVGGVEALHDATWRASLSLDLRAFDRVLDVDPVSRTARIEAGATGPRVESQLAPHGFTLRHYPQSFEFSTLGGWIATRAGGHFATLYTHIDDLVQSVRMVTPAGVFTTENTHVPASGAGPDPNRWVIGSEGALGVITQARVRVQLRPRWRLSASVRFSAFDAAVTATRHVVQAGLHPSNCRLLDAAEALLNGVFTGEGGAVLLLGFESADHAPDAAMARAVEIAREHGGECPDGVVRRENQGDARDASSKKWRDAFLEAPYLQSALVSLGVLVDTFETACTWSHFEALHADILASVGGALREHCGGGRVTCRFTHVYPDGPAPYYTFLGRARVGAELEQWAAIKSAASEALARHGATITHHHAVGRTHRPWYDRERPDLFAASLRAVKRALDPALVLNPGVLIDPE
jgi:alkyldihydroxyacetonephosphate synthase